LILATALAVASAGCPKQKAKPITPGPTDWVGATPLTDEEVATLHPPEELLQMLPSGRATPVTRIQGHEGEKTDVQLYGFAFSVRREAIDLTIHALRRQLALLDTATKPLVYGVPGPEGAHAGVAVLCRAPTEQSALRLSGLSRHYLSVKDFLKFVNDWRATTGLTLLAVDEGVLWVEVERLPADPDDATAFLTTLASYEPADGPDINGLREELLLGDPAAVSF
jgi:hypothetical protein